MHYYILLCILQRKIVLTAPSAPKTEVPLILLACLTEILALYTNKMLIIPFDAYLNKHLMCISQK